MHLPHHHHLLGFDVRESWVPHERLFPPQRRATHLLRSDVVKPLSCDLLVWPTVLRDHAVELLKLEDLALGDAGLGRGDTDPTTDLFSSLRLARVAVRLCAERSGRRGVIIAVSAPEACPFPYAPADDVADERFSLLGYDVTDGVISGLTNCCYDDASRAGLCAEWGPRLNEHHLFADIEQAEAFRAITDTRVPEHAPFMVFGVWLFHE